MVEPSSGRMLLTQSSGAWPQSRQVAIVPSWAQQAGPHSLIVDSTQFLNVEEIYPKHVQIQKYETKKQDSPIHHLVDQSCSRDTRFVPLLINASFAIVQHVAHI